MITLLSFIATLLIIVFVHEFGHYCAARFFGVRVLQFSVVLAKRCGKKPTSGGRFGY